MGNRDNLDKRLAAVRLQGMDRRFGGYSFVSLVMFAIHAYLWIYKYHSTFGVLGCLLYAAIIGAICWRCDCSYPDIIQKTVDEINAAYSKQKTGIGELGIANVVVVIYGIATKSYVMPSDARSWIAIIAIAIGCLLSVRMVYKYLLSEVRISMQP